MCGHNHQSGQCTHHASPQSSAAPTETSSVDKEVTSKIHRDLELTERLALARTYHDQGDFPRARECYEALLPMADQPGQDTSFAMEVVVSLIKIYYEQNDRQASVRLILRKRYGDGWYC